MEAPLQTGMVRIGGRGVVCGAALTTTSEVLSAQRRCPARTWLRLSRWNYVSRRAPGAAVLLGRVAPPWQGTALRILRMGTPSSGETVTFSEADVAEWDGDRDILALEKGSVGRVCDAQPVPFVPQVLGVIIGAGVVVLVTAVLILLLVRRLRVPSEDLQGPSGEAAGWGAEMPGF